jgi:hypothetical protein
MGFAVLSLSHQNGFRDLQVAMEVQTVANWMEPQACSVGDGGKIGWAVDELAGIGVGGLWLIEQLAYVDVSMALAAGNVAIHSDRPGITPDFFALGNGSVPEQEAFFRGHLSEEVRAVVFRAGKGEPAVGFGGVIIFREDDGFGGGMFFGFETEATSAGFGDGGTIEIAKAGANVGEAGACRERQQGKTVSHCLMIDERAVADERSVVKSRFIRARLVGGSGLVS